MTSSLPIGQFQSYDLVIFSKDNTIVYICLPAQHIDEKANESW